MLLNYHKVSSNAWDSLHRAMFKRYKFTMDHEFKDQKQILIATVEYNLYWGLSSELKVANLRTSNKNGLVPSKHQFKVNKRNDSKRCKICSKLATKKPEWRQWCCSGVFIVNFEHISYLFLHANCSCMKVVWKWISDL